MNRLTFLLFVLAIVAIGGGATWYLVDTRNDAFGTPANMATSTPSVTEDLSIYSNGTYGFTVFYPEDAIVSYTFEPSYHLGTAWRANALPEGLGTPVVAIIPYSVTSENSYPRYFNAMVRIGASTDPKELARCEEASTEQGETELADSVINGVSWKTFSFGDAGMMQYANGTSYRRISEGTCIAVEKVRTGSSYVDEPNVADIEQETLDAEFEKLSAIVESITFAR